MSKKSEGAGWRLAEWQERLRLSQTAYAGELAKMDGREALYLGTKEIEGVVGRDGKAKAATHVRNVVSELVESQVNSTIPQPKVTARRPQDEGKARLIEDMLRNELDRLPFELMNDQQERTCPIQGGSLFLVEWDHTRGAGGELAVSDLHPKKVIPQDGVCGDVEDMDYIFVLFPQTRQYIQRRYGVDVTGEGESDPEVRGAGSVESAMDLVTQVIAYYRNSRGGIGIFSWVGGTVLADMEDYQARQLHVCRKCDMPGDGTKCAFCGGTRFEELQAEEEELFESISLSDGTVIPAFSPARDREGNPIPGRLEPTKIPYYKPDVYPVVLRRNVSVFGRFLGDSDVDKVSDQQNTLKKLSTKIMEKLLKGGSYVTFPAGVSIDKSDQELKIINLKNPADKAMIDVITVQPNISGDLAMLHQSYEEARQIIGITDSFQGRRDATASSGVAKEFAASQAAGRLESKRVMKEAAYARLFEIMFKFRLAYADEPRPVVSTDNQGNRKYQVFNRYDFLEPDGSGGWRWNDGFLFSCDTTATLAANRQAMWSETRLNFQQGAYGNPALPETLILFWTRMEQLHYPGASDTKTYFEARREAEKASEEGGEDHDMSPLQAGSDHS